MTGSGAIAAPEPRLAGRDLPILRLAMGTRLYRSHASAYGPVYFGKNRRYRFDDPQGEYGVCYVARTVEGAFAERFLRRPGSTLIGRSDLATVSIAVLRARRSMTVVPLHSEFLARLGATAEVTHGPVRYYSVPQSWSRAIHEHALGPDGIEYKSRHDDSLLCLALFGRAHDALELEGTAPWLNHVVDLPRILDRYGVALA